MKAPMNREGRGQGRLTVLGEYKRENKTLYWLCRCLCGNTVWVEISNFRLRRGSTDRYMVESCGCLLTEWNKTHNRKHGLEGTQFYKAYFSARGRCNLPKNSSYKRYGGIGVKFLFKSFKYFRETMYESYLKHVSEYGKGNTSLDRIDCYGDYEPENCRWATWSQQNLNKRILDDAIGKLPKREPDAAM